VIDLQPLVATSLSYGHGTLTLFDDGHVVDNLAIAGSLVSADFALRPDGHGGTNVYGHNPFANGFVPATGLGAAGRVSDNGAGLSNLLITSVHGHWAV
jgi:hypothetical protein